MGKVNSYYVVGDELMDKSISEAFDLIDYINDKLLLHHDFENQPFWRANIEFGTGVKAWKPTIELLKILDKSEDGIIGKILDVNKFGGFDGPPYFIKSAEAKKVWKELKKVSVESVEKTVKDRVIADRIKNSEGYRMKAIENGKFILFEFIEIFKAFYEAQDKDMGIVVKQS